MQAVETALLLLAKGANWGVTRFDPGVQTQGISIPIGKYPVGKYPVGKYPVGKYPQPIVSKG
jgi:hypothetical protein